MGEAKVLITGGSGQVGRALVAAAQAQAVDIWAPTRHELDLLDVEALTRTVQDGKWRAVINCAAYTAVDRAEAEPAFAEAVNARAPAALAQATSRANIPIIHVSTDYVFDGEKDAPYHEADPVNPLNVYGKTKAAGEDAVRAGNPDKHMIIRTAWVLSATGSNFLNTMVRLGGEKPTVGVVDDQVGCPTSADDIAQALLTVLIHHQGPAGTWHFVNQGEITWHGLAAYIFAETKRRGLPTPNLQAIPTSSYPTAAQRPANSRLCTDRFAGDFGYQPRPWTGAVHDILNTRLG